MTHHRRNERAADRAAIGGILRRYNHDSIGCRLRAQGGNPGHERFKVLGLCGDFAELVPQCAICRGGAGDLFLLVREKLIQLDARATELRGVADTFGAARDECLARIGEHLESPGQGRRLAIDIRQRRADQHRPTRRGERIVGTQHHRRRRVVLQPFNHRKQPCDRHTIAREGP